MDEIEKFTDEELSELRNRVIYNALTPSGDYEEDKKRAMTLAQDYGMDELNKEALIVMATKGLEAAIDFMYQRNGGNIDNMFNNFK